MLQKRPTFIPTAATPLARGATATPNPHAPGPCAPRRDRDTMSHPWRRNANEFLEKHYNE